MFFFGLLSIFCFLTADLCIAAVPRDDVVLRSRNAPGSTDRDTIRALGHALTRARAENNQHTYSFNTTPLAKSWANATLFTTGDDFSYQAGSTLTSGSIDIVCSTCYFNGSVGGELVLEGNFNFTNTLENVWSDVSNTTETAWTTLENHIEEDFHDVMELDFSNLTSWPTIDVDLNLQDDLDDLPEAQVHFEFDDLEMYLDLDIKLATQSTYTINIFTTETPFGVSFTDLTLGLVFSVDLILIADTDIDIQSGIHIKIDKGLGFDFGLLNGNLSKTEVPGGSFEFLPVTIDGLGSIQAILSLQATLGVEMEMPSSVESIVAEVADVSFGISADVFAYLADFKIAVNGTTDKGSDECDLAAIAEYSLAVGAAAGATIGISNWMWGPAPATTVPVWYTTLTSMCATSRTASVTATSTAASGTDASTTTGTRQEIFSSVPVLSARAKLHQRDTMTTTAVSAVEEFTIVACSDSGVVNCPASAQSTTSFTRTVTTDVTVQSGASATFPSNTHSTVTSAIAFGSNMHRLGETSGSPTSYVPTASADSSSSSSHSSGTNDKLIIGLSVGLGAPALIAVFAIAAFYLRKRRQYSAVDNHPDTIHALPLPPMHAKTAMATPSTMQVSPLITPREF